LKARVFLPAILSGVLLWTAFFPLNWGPMGFVALVPFLTLVRADGVGNWRRYTAAWLGGLTFGGLAMNWVRHAHPMMAYFAWPLMSLYLSLYWPLALFLLRRLDRLGKPPLALTLPVVWVALEYFKAHFPAGFPFLKWVHLHQLSGIAWYFLGHTQHANLPLLQSADLGGAYLVSAAVAAVNGAAHDWFVRWRPFRWFVNLPRGWVLPVYHKEMVNAAGAACLLLVLMSYGGYQLIHKPFDQGPRVALLQDDISIEAMQSDQLQLFARYDKLARSAAAATTPPDLIVWPEACYPFADVSFPPGTEAQLPPQWLSEWALQNKRVDVAEVRSRIRNRPDAAPFLELLELGRQAYAAKHWKAYTLLGTNGVDCGDGRCVKYNSARMLNPDGTPGPRYDKMHLVPFGEYVPFRDLIPWLETFTPNPEDPMCRPGGEQTRFEVAVAKRAADGTTTTKRYTFGVLICYEDTEPTLARRFNHWSEDGKPADFLVNQSLDAWFDGSEQHEQHLAISRFRAVEARRSLVRAVNMGISAVIDPDGRVLQTVDFEWADSKKKVGVVTAEVPLDTRGSVYAAVGDWVPLLCWVGLATGLIQGRRRVTSAA
jgi:apolipoprotein N-acyltransferase